MYSSFIQPLQLIESLNRYILEHPDRLDDLLAYHPITSPEGLKLANSDSKIVFGNHEGQYTISLLGYLNGLFLKDHIDEANVDHPGAPIMYISNPVNDNSLGTFILNYRVYTPRGELNTEHYQFVDKNSLINLGDEHCPELRDLITSKPVVLFFEYLGAYE